MASDPDIDRLLDLDHQIARIAARLSGAPPPPGPIPAEDDIEPAAASLTPDEQRRLEHQLRALEREREELRRLA
jgi:hypothetical protein